MKNTYDYINKMYGGWLGKIIGVVYGANIEGWSYERIKKTFGTLSGYPYKFANFAADDDINGPIFFMRSLPDYKNSFGIAEESMGLTLLNYVPENHGFFWWGGYGISTENTAYLNLLNHILPPLSGSRTQNGSTVCNQIGGQIFSDCWGLLCPGDPCKASILAKKMSCVTHDEEGINGGMFIAACVAAAFTEENSRNILKAGYSVLPSDSAYAVLIRDIEDFYDRQPDDWEKCFHYVQEKYGYQHYSGVCHIIPNAAVVILSLLYGESDFDKSLNICNMCGWDTDCNSGNVGTIVGVLNGSGKIGEKWKDQIHDFICASSVIGSLNIQTVPQLVTDTAKTYYALYNKKPDKNLYPAIFDENSRDYFHFEYPGSTHNIRTSAADVIILNSDESSHTGKRSLKIISPKTSKGDNFRVYLKTYYTPEDFSDSRYDPDFSPIIYPGQTFEAYFRLKEDTGERIAVRPYFKDRLTGKLIFSVDVYITSNSEWNKISFRIPETDSTDVIIEEVGFEIVLQDFTGSDRDIPLTLYFDDMRFIHGCNYTVHFASQKIEKWNSIHQSISQMTYNRGLWSLEDGYLTGSFCAEPAECYTGDIYWKNIELTAIMKPLLGEFHNILFRVQGNMRFYAAGFSTEGLTLYKNSNGYKRLAGIPFKWNTNQEYIIKIIVQDTDIEIFCENTLLLQYSDINFPYLSGCIGFGNNCSSRTAYKLFSVKED